MTAAERIDLIERHAREDLGRILHAAEPVRPAATGPGFYGRLQDFLDKQDEWKDARELAEQGIICLAPARWLGRPLTHSETTLYSRAYVAGEAAGRWTRVRSNGRTWGLKLS